MACLEAKQRGGAKNDIVQEVSDISGEGKGLALAGRGSAKPTSLTPI